MTLKVEVVQLHHGSPWRWVIREPKSDDVLAASTKEYEMSGWAARAVGEFVNSLRGEPPQVTIVPSLQLMLFDERVNSIRGV